MQVITCIVLEGIHLNLSTKDKIIEAAIELVNEKGYKGATQEKLPNGLA